MQRRQGYTLVELLVAMALIVFMMVILSEAFSVGLESYRRLKAVGDMNERLRGAALVLRRDLAADHFEGSRRLSGRPSSPTSSTATTDFWGAGPPREGFFRIWQGSASVVEGRDGDNNASTHATDHMLHFTVKLRGNDAQDFFSAKVPNGSPLPALGVGDARHQDSSGTLNSQWAEVVYFLRPNGQFAGSTPLYALYRRQLVVVPEHRDLREINWGSRAVAAGEWGDYREVSCKPNPQNPDLLYFNTPTDLTVPQRRFGMDRDVDGGLPVGYDLADRRTWTYPILAEEDPARAGADLLLTDVISFDVAIAASIRTSTTFSEFVDLFHTTFRSSTNRNSHFTGTNKPRVFDTWSDQVDGAYEYDEWSMTTPAAPDHLPSRLTLRAVRITLRVWDAKTQQARQVTIVQDL